MNRYNWVIPKWYKLKYKDRLSNRKHASGYWFEYIFPRRITIRPLRLYRWLNFYFRLKDEVKE